MQYCFSCPRFSLNLLPQQLLTSLYIRISPLFFLLLFGLLFDQTLRSCILLLLFYFVWNVFCQKLIYCSDRAEQLIYMMFRQTFVIQMLEYATFLNLKFWCFYILVSMQLVPDLWCCLFSFGCICVLSLFESKKGMKYASSSYAYICTKITLIPSKMWWSICATRREAQYRKTKHFNNILFIFRQIQFVTYHCQWQQQHYNHYSPSPLFVKPSAFRTFCKKEKFEKICSNVVDQCFKIQDAFLISKLQEFPHAYRVWTAL